MKDSHTEGVANHTGPESCGLVGKLEALTGERAGRVLSRERGEFGTPTRSPKVEGHTPLMRQYGQPVGSADASSCLGWGQVSCR